MSISVKHAYICRSLFIVRFKWFKPPCLLRFTRIIFLLHNSLDSSSSPSPSSSSPSSSSSSSLHHHQPMQSNRTCHRDHDLDNGNMACPEKKDGWKKMARTCLTSSLTFQISKASRACASVPSPPASIVLKVSNCLISTLIFSCACLCIYATFSYLSPFYTFKEWPRKTTIMFSSQ